MEQEKRSVSGDDKEKKKFTDDELTRLVATSLSSGRSARSLPVWFIRVLSILAGLAALLLLLLLFRQ